MKQAIAGVVPPEVEEATVMTVWPSISVYSFGRFLGRLFAIRWPNVYIFRLGYLLALLSIPFALLLYFWRLLPRVGAAYRLTNRRIVVHRGLKGSELGSIGLEAFDSIEIDVLPGQEWLDAGDLVFKQAGNEVFRLAAVSRPKSFRQSCLKARMGYVTVREVLARQTG